MRTFWGTSQGWTRAEGEEGRGKGREGRERGRKGRPGMLTGRGAAVNIGVEGKPPSAFSKAQEAHPLIH